MTKEERAEQWFRKIPGAESIGTETKMAVCGKIAKKMSVIFLISLTVECVVLFLLSGGKIFDLTADFLNSISEGNATRNHYMGTALVGGLVCLPVMVLPFIAASIYKNKSLEFEAAKIIKSIKTEQ